jgi:CheY-like chemotaxis protein
MPPATILYVEDNALVRLTVALLLEDEGWRVETCTDGRAALSKLEGDEGFDLLLLDNNLSDVSGLELATRARRMPHRRGVSIIIFSADCCLSEARRAGADECLRKPEGVSRVVEVVRRLLDAR